MATTAVRCVRHDYARCIVLIQVPVEHNALKTWTSGVPKQPQRHSKDSVLGKETSILVTSQSRKAFKEFKYRTAISQSNSSQGLNQCRVAGFGSSKNWLG